MKFFTLIAAMSVLTAVALAEPELVTLRTTVQKVASSSASVKVSPPGHEGYAEVAVTGELDGQCDGDQLSYELSTLKKEGVSELALTLLATAEPNPYRSCSNQKRPFRVNVTVPPPFRRGVEHYRLFVGPRADGKQEVAASFDLKSVGMPE